MDVKEEILDDQRSMSFIINGYRGCHLHILYVLPIQFESLKDLLKEIAKTEAADTSNLRKRGFSTPIYNGPVSRREPSSMGHIQAWIVDDRIAMEGATNCGINRKPPFTEESIKRLPALFSEALRFFRDREAIRRKWNSSVARNEL